jgi:hypothetical protein
MFHSQFPILIAVGAVDHRAYSVDSRESAVIDRAYSSDNGSFRDLMRIER